VPIVVHEANARPGLANRIGSLLTRHVCTGQHGTRLLHGRYIGTPIRRQIAGLDRLALADTARAHFGLALDLPVLLVTGGSQGAASLNRAVFGAAAALRAAGVQVLHVVGPKNADIEVPPGPVPYVVLPYLDRMDLGYAAADFALCRAGAMTCAELTAVGMPAAYVPLPHGNGEQRLNAEPIEEAGGGLIIEDADLSPDWIAETLLPVLLDGELVAAMGQAAAATGNRDADRDLAALVLSVGRGPRPSRPGLRPRSASQPGRRARPGGQPGHRPGSRAAADRAPWR
jgi:UDP-N-acetylglucosamine--N-acetylmuramyl-(pentapeptide) pyrophosphoryl-undecaprenol N-acetylglucosamine transferase